jgi:hypothetical protein
VRDLRQRGIAEAAADALQVVGEATERGEGGVGRSLRPHALEQAAHLGQPVVGVVLQFDLQDPHHLVVVAATNLDRRHIHVPISGPLAAAAIPDAIGRVEIW